MANFTNSRTDIIIPAFILTEEQLSKLKKCIESIEKNTKNYRLIIIDNASSKEASEYIKKKADVYIRNEENLGFTKAVNQGLKRVEGNYFVICNADIIVPSRWLEKLIIRLEENDNLLLVGPASDSPEQLQGQVGRNKGLVSTSMVAFFCTVFKRKALNVVGYLDEQFFIYGDDDDYCWRVKKAGYNYAVDTNVLVHHDHSITAQNYDYAKVRNESWQKLTKKWQKKVLIAILNQGNMRVDLSNIKTQMTHNTIHKIKIYYPSDQPIEENRNKIVQKFLKEDWDYLLMIDNDIVPINNPLNLVALDKDIIGCICPQWHETDLFWVVMDKADGGYRQVPVEKRRGLREVDAIGTGCILIARRVLEKIKAPFIRKWDENGLQELGLDFYFCERAREAGFKVWAHWGYPCRHYKEIDLMQVYELLTKDKNGSSNG